MSQLLALDGSNTTPGLNFSSNHSSGLYLSNPATGVVSFSSAGVQAFDISPTAVTAHGLVTLQAQGVLPLGTVGAPGLAFTSDLSTGIFKQAPHTISFASSGFDVLDLTSTNIIFNAQTTFFGDNRISTAGTIANTNFVLNTSAIARTNNEQDVFIGVGAGDLMPTNVVESDVFIGYHAGNKHTTHINSVIIGAFARANSTTSTGNSVHIGANCGINSNGGSQTMIGFNAGALATQNCTIIGVSAASLATSGQNCTIVGGSTFSALTTGTDNTCVGEGSGQIITTGSFNSFFGRAANASLATRSHGTAIGAGAIVTADSTVQLGRLGMDAVSCGSSISVNGNQVTDGSGHLVRIGASGSLGFTLGPGAGSGSGSGTLAAGSTDASGQITVTTGTAPAAASAIVTINFAQAYSLAPVMIITPANQATSALVGVNAPFVSSNTTGGSTIESNNALAAGTYSWWYHVMH